MERFRNEYEKLHRALKTSYESEKRLVKRYSYTTAIFYFTDLVETFLFQILFQNWNTFSDFLPLNKILLYYMIILLNNKLTHLPL